MNLKKNYHYFVTFFIFILLTFILLSYIGYERHWGKNLDLEFTLLYNALLFNNGIPIEYTDHPGFFTILGLSLFLKFISFFNFVPVHKLSLLNSENFDSSFKELIFFTRIYGAVWISLFCTASYIFFNKFSKHKFYSLILTLLVFFSQGTIFPIAQLRTELVAMFFIILSLICLKTFLEDKTKYRIFKLSGFFIFMIFALLNKMQIFFLIPLFLAVIYFSENKFYDFDVSEIKFLNNKWVPYFLIIIILFYIYISNHTQHPFPILSALAVILNIFLINFFFFFIIKKDSKKIKINLIVINLTFILSFFLVKNFLSIHPSANEIIFLNLTRIMHIAQYVTTDSDIFTNKLDLALYLAQQFYVNFINVVIQIITKLDYFTFLLILNLFLMIIFRKFLTPEMIKFNIVCLVVSILLMVINSFRIEGIVPPYYKIFSDLIIVLSFCNFSKILKIKYLSIILILAFTLNFKPNYDYLKSQKINDQKEIINHFCNSNYLEDFHKKIKPKYYKKICENNIL